MKKLTSAILVLALVLSLGITAFADAVTSGTAAGEITSAKVGMDEDPNMSFQVEYQNTAGNLLGEKEFPYGDKLKFNVVSDPDNPDLTTFSIPEYTVKENPCSVKIPIPTNYTMAGKYNYTITQVGGTAFGAVYDTSTAIKVQVLVENNTNNEIEAGNPTLLKTVTFSQLNSDQNKKVNSLVNKYDATDSSATKFTLQKKIAGNLAVKQDYSVTVTLEKPSDDGLKVLTPVVIGGSDEKTWGDNATLEFTVDLNPSESATSITGVPVGVTYTVKESDSYAEENKANPLPNDPTKGYTITYALNGEDKQAANPANEKIEQGKHEAVVITNTKNDASIAPDTGVYLEAMPYIILLAVAAVGLVLFVVKRRANREY